MGINYSYGFDLCCGVAGANSPHDREKDYAQNQSGLT